MAVAGRPGRRYTTTARRSRTTALLPAETAAAGGARPGGRQQGNYGGDGGAGVSGLDHSHKQRHDKGDGEPRRQAVGASIGGGRLRRRGIEGTSIAITNNGTIAAGTGGKSAQRDYIYRREQHADLWAEW